MEYRLQRAVTSLTVLPSLDVRIKTVPSTLHLNQYILQMSIRNLDEKETVKLKQFVSLSSRWKVENFEASGYISILPQQILNKYFTISRYHNQQNFGLDDMHASVLTFVSPLRLPLLSFSLSFRQNNQNLWQRMS